MTTNELIDYEVTDNAVMEFVREHSGYDCWASYPTQLTVMDSEDTWHHFTCTEVLLVWLGY